MTGGIVVLGGAGMLGHKLFQVLRERFPGTIATTREDVRVPPLAGVTLLGGVDVLSGVDVVDFDALRARLEKLAPDVIVNCIGVIKQRDEAKSPIPSITLNALFPHRLAEAAAGMGWTCHPLQHRLRVQRKARELPRGRLLRRGRPLREDRSFSARSRRQTRSRCGRRSSAGSLPSTGLFSTGSCRRRGRRSTASGK